MDSDNASAIIKSCIINPWEFMVYFIPYSSESEWELCLKRLDKIIAGQRDSIESEGADLQAVTL